MIQSIQQTSQNYQDLFAAIEAGETETTEKIFATSPFEVLEETDSCGITLLHYAICLKQPKIAKLFIQQMNLLQLNKRDGLFKITAREWAVKKKDEESLSALDQRTSSLFGANPKCFNEFFKRTKFEGIQWDNQFRSLKQRFGLLAAFTALITLQTKGIHHFVDNFGAIREVLKGKDPLFITPKTDELLFHYFPTYKTLSIELKKEICEYLRRVTKPELAASFIEIQWLRPLKGEEAQALKEQNWDHPIFQNLQVHFFALREFIEGRINNYDLSEILIYDQCLRGDVQSDFTQAISIGKDKERASALLIRSTTPYFSEEEIAKFLAEPSLQNCQFYVIPFNVLSAYDDKGEETASVLYQIVERLKHTFLTYKEGKHIFQAVMSPRLMTALYRLKFGDQAPCLNAVLGPSISAENFTDPTKRDVLVPSRLFPQSQPTKADDYIASPLEFWHHDAAYHVYLSCLNPHRKLFLEVAQFAKNSGHQSVYLKLLDQEFSYYKTLSASEAFFKTLELLYAVHSNSWGEQIRGVAEYLEENRERLEREYNLIFPSSKKWWDPRGCLG